MNPIFKITLHFIFLTIISSSCSARKADIERNTINDLEQVTKNPKTEIITGADNYANYLHLLKNQKIGIVTNQTGILSDKTHLVDFLIEKNIAIQKIFAPEHGFRGTADAGEQGPECGGVRDGVGRRAGDVPPGEHLC